ncbi:MAG: hypothetical protein M3R13_05050 [Armatimonadota bacterium]|nr:hypothetical protein [Armatimonadota bacterium]
MRFAYLAAIATLALVGCIDDGGLDFDRVERSDDFFPDKFEMPVTLRLANVSIEAEAKMSVDGTTRTIHIVQDGVPIEEEVYVVSRDSIAVRSLGTGESFEPPLVLIEFPFTIGDKFGWVGKLGFAGPQFATTAAITTSRDRPDLPTGPRETLKVAVELKIDDGSPKPAMRKLDFWFAEGVGPIRRDYGNQVRMPR